MIKEHFMLYGNDMIKSSTTYNLIPVSKIKTKTNQTTKILLLFLLPLMPLTVSTLNQTNQHVVRIIQFFHSQYLTKLTLL
jgi:hypothetical protein